MDDLKDFLITHALKLAPTSPYHAEDVLDFFRRDVEAGRTPDPRIMKYLAECFGRILDGDAIEATDALNLRLGQGQRRRRTLERGADRDAELAAAVVRHRAHGKSYEEAIEHVADERGARKSTVRDAYHDFREYWEAEAAFHEQLEKEGATPGTKK